MARPPFRLYEGGSAPRPNATPMARNIDVSSGQTGLARSLGRLGQGVQRIADVNLDIERIQHARAQDDARVQVAQRMAEARREAGEIRRRAFEEAPDGWQGATERVAQDWSELRQRYLSDPSISTPEAQTFLSQSLDLFEPELLDSAAEQQTTARRQWRTDTANSATDTLSGVINADPNQYDALRAQHLELIGGLHDITADQRRALESRAEEQFALSAVAGMVERDPRSTLALLRDPEAEGPIAQLTGPQRDAYANRAQAELNRRQSEARAAHAQFTASLRDTVNAQNQLLQRGIVPDDPVDISVVAQALGPDVAQAYLANLAGASAQQQMAGLPSAAVAQVAAGSVTEGNSDLDNLLNDAGRDAASQVLTQRREDPGGYALRNGLMRHGDLMAQVQTSIQNQDWSTFQQVFRDRGADAMELRRNGVTPRVAPLSAGEASALGAWLNQQPAQMRLGFFSQAASAMNPEAYRAMMVQIAPDGGEVTAYAGFRYADNPTVARRLLRGQELLGANPQDGESRRSTPTISLPSDDWLRERWEQEVGDAYRGLPNAAAPAYETYRAYYAAASEEAGDLNAGAERGNSTRAHEAAGAASGGLITWGGRRTIMPAGMRASEFETAVRRGLSQWDFLRDADPRDYSLTAIGGGRYQVDGVRNPVSGRPVEIRIQAGER